MKSGATSGGDLIWLPRPDDLERSHAARLMRRHGLASASELRERAAKDPEWFYPAILEDLGVEWYEGFRTLADRRRGLPFTDWFLGGKLNIVHNVLDRHLRTNAPRHAAVIAEDDEERVTRLSYDELNDRVCRLAAALSGLEVREGDAVGLYLPMAAEVVVALLACLKIGRCPCRSSRASGRRPWRRGSGTHGPGSC